MEETAELLPEPFSEKNIDGSPIDKSAEGKTLFRTSPKFERRVADRRGSERRGDDRRSGTDRRVDDHNAGYTDPSPKPSADPVPETLAEAHPLPYTEPRQYIETQSYSDQIQITYTAPEATAQADSDTVPDAGPGREPASGSYPEHITEPSYDPERFDPPVDEKPGMIPNPMKMPPVKKKSSIDYDMDDSDYGDYTGSDTDASLPSDDGYGYEAESSSDEVSDDYGYSFDEPSPSMPDTADDSRQDIDDAPSSEWSSDTEDLSYGSYDTSGIDNPSDTPADDYGSDYGTDAGMDDDYGADYDSGSDYSSDYY